MREGVDPKQRDHAGRVAQAADLGQQLVPHHVHRAAAGEPCDQALIGRAIGRDQRLDRQDARR